MSHPSYVVLEKPVGQTPLEAIAAWKAAHLTYASLPATYAGRLDPMASGKLLVLLGNECRNRDSYLGMDKEYEIEIVFGAATDTGDALGLAHMATPFEPPSHEALTTALSSLTGTHSVPYPSYSSKTVRGIPLFQHALEGTLSTISVPEHEETIYAMKLQTIQTVTSLELLHQIQTTLTLVPRSDQSSKKVGADFRQDGIRARWNELLGRSEAQFPVVTLRVTCASGTYMRTFAKRLGTVLGTRGFALSIHRTKIGKYRSFGSFGFWTKKYYQ